MSFAFGRPFDIIGTAKEGKNMAFGDNIRKLREEKGFTQQQLADRLYVSRQTVCRWENGSRQPDLDMAEKVAEVFQVSLDELITKKEQQGCTFDHMDLQTGTFTERKRLQEQQKRILDVIQIIGAVYMVITVFVKVRLEMSVPAWCIILGLCVEGAAVTANLLISRKLEKL